MAHVQHREDDFMIDRRGPQQESAQPSVEPAASVPAELPGSWSRPSLTKHAPLRDITLFTSTESISGTTFVASADEAAAEPTVYRLVDDGWAGQ